MKMLGVTNKGRKEGEEDRGKRNLYIEDLQNLHSSTDINATINYSRN
jgi:hypothetical protein